MGVRNLAALLVLFGIRVEADTEGAENRISNSWDSVKNYFKGLNLDIHEKSSQFGGWVRDNVPGLKEPEPEKGQLDHVKSIATAFVDHSKELSHEVATEGHDFLQTYKDDLGDLWDKVKDKYNYTIHGEKK